MSNLKKENEAHPFHPHLEHHMAAFQSRKQSDVWSMKGFMDKKEWSGLKEQELFYRATNYRGS